jgi:DNA sulfur modification protein DndD
MASIKILRWKASGLRCPDHEFSFESTAGNVHPLTLIQMPNGTGKTTTLTLIRAALSGSGADGGWDAARVRSFAKRGAKVTRGEFQIAFMINTARYTVTMRFDYEEGRMEFATTGGSGLSSGFNIPAHMKEFLRPEFVPYFVFDGELAEQLLNHELPNAQEVIERLFRLDLFESIKVRVNEHWEKKVSQKGAVDTKGLTQRRNRLQRLREQLEALKTEQKKTQGELNAAKDALRRKKAKFNASIAEKEEFRVKMERANAAVDRARTAVAGSAKDAFARLRDPHAVSGVFASEMLNFKNSLDRVKLPESTAREFFEELAQESLCVCGRPLDDHTRQAIRDRAKQYLGTDDVALLNCIKGDISTAVADNTAAAAAELTAMMTKLREAMREQGERELERDQIRQQAVDADPALESVKQEISDLEALVQRLNDVLEEFENLADGSLLDDQVRGIRVVERRIATAELKYAEITATLNLKEKRDILNRILDAAGQKARVGMCEDICRESNQRISQLIPDNRITIERIERSLHLEGQAGGSVGETLSVAYAFLSTLFNRADNKLPFIVDSPANPIDLRVRGKVAALVPKLAQQFIAFTISSERDGFLVPLETAAPKEIQYLTMFRKEDKGAPPKEVAKDGRMETTADGVIVTGRTYFHAFHIDKEAGNGR